MVNWSYGRWLLVLLRELEITTICFRLCTGYYYTGLISRKNKMYCIRVWFDWKGKNITSLKLRLNQIRFFFETRNLSKYYFLAMKYSFRIYLYIWNIISLFKYSKKNLFRIFVSIYLFQEIYSSRSCYSIQWNIEDKTVRRNIWIDILRYMRNKSPYLYSNFSSSSFFPDWIIFRVEIIREWYSKDQNGPFIKKKIITMDKSKEIYSRYKALSSKFLILTSVF